MFHQVHRWGLLRCDVTSFQMYPQTDMLYKYGCRCHHPRCTILVQMYAYELLLKFDHTNYCEHSFGVLKSKMRNVSLHKNKKNKEKVSNYHT